MSSAGTRNRKASQSRRRRPRGAITGNSARLGVDASLSYSPSQGNVFSHPAKARAEEFDRLDGAFSGRPPAGEMAHEPVDPFRQTNKDHFRAQRRRRPSAALDPLAGARRERSMSPDRCETDFAAMAFQLFGQRKPKLAVATDNCGLVVHSRACATLARPAAAQRARVNTATALFASCSRYSPLLFRNEFGRVHSSFLENRKGGCSA
jgi:hypothetical protein